jgi:pimeloyl-ACP methyl ester carboxylesterase
MRQTLFLTFLVLVNLSCAAIEPPTALPRAQSRIELKPCRFPNHERELLCGKYFVHENRAAKTGRTIGLNIVIVPALATKPAPDPVFFLAGGPGQGAARIAQAGEDALMRELRGERDLVFIDQRGSGDSKPLPCAVTADRGALQTYFQEIFEIDMIRACRQSLEKEADLKFYITPIVIDDIDDIRRELGYDKINLYGISYGTRSALEYLRRYPNQIRAALLAGVATPAAKLPLHYAKGAQSAMEKLIEDCAADASCRSAFPALDDDLAAALDAFANGPVSFEMNHPVTKTRQTVTLSRSVFTERLRLMLYDHAASSLIPFVIQRAAHGDWLPFGKVVVRPVPASAYSLALGTYLSITCSESVPLIDRAEISQETSGTFLREYRTLRHRSACAEWPRGDIPHDFFLPVKSDVPVLMLSGDSDPATPMDFGKAALQHLTNGRQILLRNTPHSYTSECVRALSVEFIAKTSVRNLNTSCAEKMRRPRFVTELPERYQ